jgi:hypothetical protein
MNDFEIAIGLGAWLAIGSMGLLYNNYPLNPVEMAVIPFACVFGIYIAMQAIVWLAFILYYILSIMFRYEILFSSFIIFLISVATYTIVSVAHLVKQHELMLQQEQPVPVS